MMFEKDDRIKIWGDIKSLCSEAMQDECEAKLQSIFAYENYDMYFERLQDIHYAIEPLLNEADRYYSANMDIDKVLFALLDALEAYEYFNRHVKINKKDYDYTKIRKKFEELKPLLVADCEITLRVPLHPNTVYNDTLFTLIEECGLRRDAAAYVLNVLYGIDKKLPQTKQAKKEYIKVLDMLNKILDHAEDQGHDQDDIERDRNEISKLKKYT